MDNTTFSDIQNLHDWLSAVGAIFRQSEVVVSNNTEQCCLKWFTSSEACRLLEHQLLDLVIMLPSNLCPPPPPPLSLLDCMELEATGFKGAVSGWQGAFAVMGIGRWKLLGGGRAHFWRSDPEGATWCHRHHLLGGSGGMPPRKFWKQRSHFLQSRHFTGLLKWLFKRDFYLSWIEYEWVMSMQMQCMRGTGKRWVIMHSDER